MSTLIEVMPMEFGREYRDVPSYRHKDVEVVAVHGDVGPSSMTMNDRWPGPQKNVYFWVELANGYAVGWNENPARGWSFPMVRIRK